MAQVKPARLIGHDSGLNSSARLHSSVIVIAAAGALIMLSAGWMRRWTSDDGLISVRIAEQIAAGNGPAVNPGERVEASTSVLWPWLLAPLAWLPGNLAWVAVVSGILLTAAAVVVAVVATARLHGGGPAVPFGVLVVLAVPAFWDFASSGLETGLSFFWLALSWLALAETVRRGSPPRYALPVWSLGSLVRPELGIVTVASIAAAALISRWSKSTTATAFAVGLLPTVVYEVFRAGYYGVLVPNTAITKEAGLANWSQGLWYAGDLVVAYQLWIPLLVVAFTGLSLRHEAPRPLIVAVSAQTIAGLAMGVYLVRVGGDFMHARLLLPTVFCLVLPASVLQWRRGFAMTATMAVMVCWAALAVVALRPAYSGTSTIHGIVDERSQLRSLRGDDAVITPADHEQSNEAMTRAATRALQGPAVSYVPYDGWRNGTFLTVPVAERDRGVLAAHALGVTSHVAASRSLYVQDLLGLSDPVTAHYRLEGRGRPGHEKWLPDAWLIARFADPRSPAHRVQASDVTAASHALRCGALADLQESYSAPMTLARFWSNMTGSISRTSFRFPVDPRSAEDILC